MKFKKHQCGVNLFYYSYNMNNFEIRFGNDLRETYVNNIYILVEKTLEPRRLFSNHFQHETMSASCKSAILLLIKNIRIDREENEI